MVAQDVGLAADLFVELNLRHDGNVVGAPEGGALVAVAAFRVRHYFFSR
jgi:hypothetical protein